MPTSLLMPSLSPTMEEGVLAKWLVKPGDHVKPGTMLCSVETDKTTVDYEAMDEGYLRQVLVKDGESAKVNQLIGILTEEKEEGYEEFLQKALKKNAALLGGKGAGASGAEPNAAAPSGNAGAVPASGAGNLAGTGNLPASGSAPAAFPALSSTAASHEEGQGGRVFASPLARKMAQDRGLDLAGLSGSGPSGRIVKKDVEAYRAPAPASAPASPAGKSAPVEPSRPLFGSLAPASPTRDIPLNMMRKTIGRRLLESTQGIPVFYVSMKIEMDALEELRARLNRTPGYKISVNDLVIKATAFALRQFPQVNSTFHGDFIRQHAEVDICVAVSIEGGLITPMVKSADAKGLGALSAEVKQLVARAKAGKLSPEEYQGGTFTLSNMGMYGVDSFTSIINPPQSAILAVAGIQGELYRTGDGEIAERRIMTVTLSADHRVVDGALAAQFLVGLKAILENPVCLML